MVAVAVSNALEPCGWRVALWVSVIALGCQELQHTSILSRDTHRPWCIPGLVFQGLQHAPPHQAFEWMGSSGLGTLQACGRVVGVGH